MTMPTLTQAAAPPKSAGIWPGQQATGGRAPVSAKDHSPPGPEPPPPNDAARRKEATSQEPNAPSNKPDFSSKVTPNAATAADGETAPAQDLIADGIPPGDSAETTQPALANAIAAAQQAFAVVASGFFRPVEAPVADIVPESADLTATSAQNGSRPLPIDQANVLPAADVQTQFELAGGQPADVAPPAPKSQTGERPKPADIAAAQTQPIVTANGSKTQKPQDPTGQKLQKQIAIGEKPKLDPRESGSEAISLQVTPPDGSRETPDAANAVPIASAPTSDSEAIDDTATKDQDISVVQSQSAVAQSEGKTAKSIDPAVDDANRAEAVPRPDAAAPANQARPAEQEEAPASKLEEATAQPESAQKAPATGERAKPVDEAQSSTEPVTESASTLDKAKPVDAAQQPVLQTQTPAERPKSVDRVTAANGPSEAAPLSQVDSKRVLAQAADRIEVLAAVRPRNAVQVRLEPEHLGIITIKIAGNSREIEAELHASDDSVRAALQAQRSDLTQTLHARGITVHALSVGSDAASASTDSQKGTAQQDGQAARTQHGLQSESSTTSYTLDSARRATRSADGVDLWI